MSIFDFLRTKSPEFWEPYITLKEDVAEDPVCEGIVYWEELKEGILTAV
jgi:hypothetical protein